MSGSLHHDPDVPARTVPVWKIGRTAPPGTPPVAGSHHDVVVVGAGITGLATALRLARAGRDVAVVDAGEVAELTTGGNTGKVSLLQGTVLSGMRRFHPASLVRAYVDANRAGQEWVQEFAASAGVALSRRTALTYAQTPHDLDRVRAEFDAAREAGLDVRMLGAGDLPGSPFPFAGAVGLDDQFAVDPVALADAMAREAVAAGAALHTGTRVTGVHVLGRPHVDTPFGPLYADAIVLATGTPIVDRGLTFAKTRGLRSWCVAFATDQPLPDELMLSVDDDSRSIRVLADDDGRRGSTRLVVGGGGHAVGRADSERDLVGEIVSWTRRYVPDAVETQRWSAQDYESANRVPFVGGMPRGLFRLRFATGYAKWGLTNAPWAAMRLADEILGTPWHERPRWMLMIGTRLTVPADIGRGALEQGKVAAAAAKGWVDSQAAAIPVPQPAEGEGVVARRGVAPVGISTVDGQTRAVGAVCPHLGGVLAWNDAECTWDCPLHASRFRADGTRIEGPATSDLPRLDDA